MKPNKWRSFSGCAIFEKWGIFMRKLLWFSTGFAAACAICANYLWNKKLFLPFSAFLIFAIIILHFAKKHKITKIVSAVSLGVSLGFAWFSFYNSAFLRPIAPLDRTTISLSITASDYAKQSTYSYSVSGTTEIDGKTYPLILYLKGEPEIRPGDILTSEYRLRVTAPAGTTPSSYYQGNGVFLTATQKGELNITRPDKTPVHFLPAVFAKEIKGTLVEFFPENTVAFAKALLLGDTTDLTYSEDTALTVSGIRHIAAVSGLHVGVLFGLVLLLFGFNKVLMLVITLPVLLVYAAMTGFTPSVTRACIMTALIALSWVIFEEYDSLSSLAFAAFVMLIRNPFVINSVSFQLSVASVLGILLFGSPIHAFLRKKLPKIRPKGLFGKIAAWLTAAISISISAMAFTTPLCAWYFGAVSIVCILTNLLTLWAIGIIFVGTAIVGVLGNLLPTVCQILALCISWLIGYVLSVAEGIARFPFAAVYTQSHYIVIWLILCYCLLFLFLLKKRRGVLLTAIGVGSLIGAIVLSVWIPRQDDVRLTVLDVGEGQCILVQSEGHNLLIDCGGDSDETAADMAAQTLLSQGITHLDGIAFTHYDRDHTGAVQNLMTRIRVDTLYLPDGENNGFWESIGNTPAEKVIIRQNTQLPFGCGVFTFTEPGQLKNDNENCMCVLFESKSCVILVTGDRSRSGEKRLIRNYDLPHVDILIGGHHGSKNSTSEELLEAVNPDIVIFSVGKDNTYGHPAQEVLDRLENYNCTVYRTDLDGSVLIRR